MKKIYYITLLIISIVSNAQTLTGSSTDIGITEGQLSVSLTGAANYSIPIAVPPGLNGVVPQISLSYSSQAGNGLAGYGWNISGVSSITRIPSTKFHNGENDPVDFDTLDQFALDGQRLIETNNTSGWGSEFVTENYTNLKIKRLNAYFFQGVLNPLTFEVKYPDGSIAIYSNGLFKNEWKISSWTNLQGIKIEYEYILDGQLQYVTSIKYGSVSGTAQINEILFEYEDRIRSEQSNTPRTSTTLNKILKRIEVKGNNTMLRNYVLTYNSTSSGYQRLESIIEKNSNNESLNPTIFSYEDTPHQVAYNQSATLQRLTNINLTNAVNVSGDFDGDGSLDSLIYRTVTSEAYNVANVYTNINSANGNVNYTWGSIGSFIKIFPTSFLNQQNKLSTKQGFTAINLVNVNPNPPYQQNHDNVNFRNFYIENGIISQNEKQIVFPNTRTKHYFDGDFNGDGLTDVIAVERNQKPTNPSYYTKQAYFIDLDRRLPVNSMNLAGTLVDFVIDSAGGNPSDPGWIQDAYTLTTGDINGDGKTDLLHFTIGKLTAYTLNNLNQLVVLFTYEDSDIKGPLSTENYYGIRRNINVITGDYNGDGKMDFLIPNNVQNGGNVWHKYISTGGFINKTTHTFNITFSATVAGQQQNWMANDFDNDGKSDLILYVAADGVNGSGFVAISCYRNMGGIFVAGPFSEYSANSANSAIPGLQSGINQFAVPIVYNSNQPNRKLEAAYIANNKVHFFSSLKDCAKEHLLKTITTGNGVVESIVYKSLKNETCGWNGCNSVYESTPLTENYPNTDIVIAPTFKVVNQITRQSASVFKKQSFMYYGAVANYEGLGFLGFRGITTTNWVDANNTNLISSVSLNDISLRGANKINYSIMGFYGPQSLVPTSGFISKSINTYNTDNTSGIFENPLQANKVYKLKNTKTETFNGIDNTSAITTTNYDVYNNPLISETLLKNGTVDEQKTKTTIGYEHLTTGTTPYIIGRPKTKEVEVKLLPSNDISLSEDKYDYPNHLLTKIEKRSTNSGQTTPWLTEDNTYDAVGNITKKIITVLGATPRETNYEYSPTYGGRFVTKTFDIEGLMTEFTYDPATGAVLTETLPSKPGFPLKTTFSYDAWGKKIKMKDYLNKETNIHYTRQTEKTLITTTSDDNTTTSELFDDLGRTLYKSESNLSSTGSSYIHYKYDIYDRITHVSEPTDSSTAPTSTNLWNETQYDAYGRVKTTIAATGTTANITFAPLSITSTITPPPVNGINKFKTITKNASGKTLSLTENTGGTINYKYFANGNLKESEYQNVVTTISQDGWGRKKELIDPSAGTYSYEYFPFGEIKKETTPKGTTDYTYYPNGKIWTKHVKDNISTAFTNTNILSEYFYDTGVTELLEKIEVTNPNDGNCTYNYFYDDYKRLNRTKEDFTTIVPRKFEKLISFDDFGRVLTETNSALAHGKSSTKTTYNEYDKGQLKRIKDTDSNGQILWEQTNQNTRGQILSEKIMVGTSNNLLLNTTFDNYGFPTNFDLFKQVSGVNTNIANLGFNTNPLTGNLTSRSNTLFSWNESFGYDDLDRLTSFNNAQGVSTTQTYNDNGTILANTLGTYNFTANTKPYQNSSVILSDAGKAYYGSVSNQVISYNAFKSPIQITQSNERISFGYNAMQDRSIMYYGSAATDKMARPLRKYYSGDGSIEIKYTKATSTIPEKVEFFTYIAGDAYSSPIVVKQIDNNPPENFYLLRDYQGSILAVVNQAGTLVEKRLYDAWGDILKVQDGNGVILPKLTFFDRGYTGHEHLQSVRIIHMNGRLYDPKLHRFLQPDNYVQDPSNTQNFNRYGYCYNNPLKFSDPSGEFFWAAPLIYAAVNLGVDMVINKGNMNFGEITMSLGQGALSGVMGGATTYAGAFIGAFAGQINKFMPAMPIYQSEGFNISASPFIGYGTSGFASGISLNASAQIGDVVYSASVGFGSNQGASSLGEAMGASNFWNAGGFIGYNDGHANYGFGYSFSSYDGNMPQKTGSLTVQAGDFGFQFINDIFHGTDQGRTAGIQMSYKVNDEITWVGGLSMMTGQANGKGIKGGNPNMDLGMHNPSTERMPTLRSGVLYGGTVYKGQANFYGHNSERRLHGVQNTVHRSWPIYDTEYFPDRNLAPKSYTFSGSYHSNYLFW